MNYRCHERDKRDQRCRIEGQHQVITNSHGQKAIVHETKMSMWSVPVSRTIEVFDNRVQRVAENPQVFIGPKEVQR